MTVRAWITISAIALLALATAFAVRVFQPLRPPDLIVSANDLRLEGAPQASCWPQRSGDVRCETPQEDLPEDPNDIPPEGRLRVIAAFPVQPDSGSVRFAQPDGGTVATYELGERVVYDVRQGSYVLTVEADYGDGAYVRWAFPVRVTDG